MPRRPLLLLGLLASCTFPSVTYDSDAGAPDATTDATGDDASANDGGVPEAQDDGDDPCDHDHDGYRATSCEGGTDCDDNDPRVHPGLTEYVYDVPDSSVGGDWNCDGTVEYEYPQLTCTLNIANCNAGKGFNAVVSCGYAAYLEDCVGLCAKTDAGIATQGCE